VRARIVSGHLTQTGQFCAEWKTFNTSPKMRACGTGRKIAEYGKRKPQKGARK
jgi:hypothetical protein